MRVLCSVVCASLIAGTTFVFAGEPPQSAARAKTPGKAPPPRMVEMFAATEAGEVEVRIIPRDEKQARIFVTNKTDEPLRVKLPAVYGAVPLVLAQFNAQPGGNQPTQQMPQQFGGPISAPQRNNNPLGIFNIPPGQTRDVKVAGVCFEYGKRSPRSMLPYRVVPLATITSDPAVEHVLRNFGDDKCSQKVAQAAVWNLNSGLAWSELAKEKGSMIAAEVFDPYFTKQELSQARGLVAAAQDKQSAESETTEVAKSLGETK